MMLPYIKEASIILLIIVLAIISGLSKAIIDKVAWHFDVSVFSRMNPLFWNPLLSYQNKYVVKWKIFDNKVYRYLKQTVLVWTTDAWHLFQMIYGISFALSFTLMGMYYPIWVFIPLYALNRIIFQLFFTKFSI